MRGALRILDSIVSQSSYATQTHSIYSAFLSKIHSEAEKLQFLTEHTSLCSCP